MRHGVKNVEFRLGDMEELPIDDAAVDLVFFSQSLHHALHPERALDEASRILRPGGRIVLLDLVKHRFEEARELYADEWLGFSEAEIEEMLRKPASPMLVHPSSTKVPKSRNSRPCLRLEKRARFPQSNASISTTMVPHVSILRRGKAQTSPNRCHPEQTQRVEGSPVALALYQGTTSVCNNPQNE